MAEPIMPEELGGYMRVLNESRDRDTLTTLATNLAASEDASALFALAGPLSNREFLARLDDVENPVVDMDNLMVVLRALAQHPTPASLRVCVLLYNEPEFRENPSRINPLLVAMAEVRPTSPEAAKVFRTSSREGYAGVNGPLLVQNESPLALQVFEELIEEDWLDSDAKVDLLHWSVLPKRTSLPVLRTCATLLDRALPAEVKTGILETLFDHESKRWFGPVLTPPAPPPWEVASTEALDLLIKLAERYPSATSTLRELEGLRKARETAT